MATKRRGSAKRKAGGKRAAARARQQPRKRRAPTAPRAGTREKRREAAARTVEGAAAAADLTGAADLRLAGDGHDPEMEQALPEVTDEAGERADEAASEPAWVGMAAGVPGYARLVALEDDAGVGADERGRGSRRLRDDVEWSMSERLREPSGVVPSLTEIGVELALGAMRLARTIATAPLRIALAFLRARDA